MRFLAFWAMLMPGFTEDELIEQPAIALFAELGYETARCFRESYGAHGTLGREHQGEVVLTRRLRAALERLNPGLPDEAISTAIGDLTRDRSALSPVHANQEVYRLLKDGVKVTFRDERGEDQVETVRVIDWNEPQNNDFLLASQLRVTGDIYRRRADLVAFVNGLPLVLFELKASHKRLEDAYNHNLRDYKSTIPQLFWYNAFNILSNGSQSRIGTITAEWEHFAEWKRINDEGEQGVVSLETMIRGTCEPARLLDLVENFILFSDIGGKPIKVVAKNHQYLGVNRAFARLRDAREGRRRLGVFWHTQGSGKSFSMVFFTQKVLRKLPGDWTFVMVTDRKELDDQIYQTLVSAGAVQEAEGVHAETGDALKRLLRENHRYVFTLIQKFRTEPGEEFPVLSERRDVIVITDEAHRTQYATLAMNMRRALPNAGFIAFTGTPLIVGEEKTREVFGDYISIYNFRQAVEDGATVPLYYENRVPEVQLTNETLNEDLEALIEAAELDEEQERLLERQFAREYQLITRDDRLERIAADIVEHYLGRFEAAGDRVAKAMVVSIDKATTVRMYDKVQRIWQERLAQLREEAEQYGGAERSKAEWVSAGSVKEGNSERERIERLIRFMETTDMAVVVSQSQNEEAEFAEKGLDIRPHRLRMVSEDLEQKFKDPKDPFRIVFVTAMWMTGFDVPCLETIYLDKPLRNHTLMQTIARANRVFAGKTNGLIVDYVGIFRDLEKALAIYGAAAGGQVAPGDMPVQSKDELIARLREEIGNVGEFLRNLGVDLDAIQRASANAWERLRLLDDAREAILVNDETKARFLGLANSVVLLYRAILPDVSAQEFAPVGRVIAVMAERIQSLSPQPDISWVMRQVEELLDASIAAEGYVIREDRESRIVDLSTIDFKSLSEAFAEGRQNTTAAELRGAIERKLREMVERNRTRIDFEQRLQALIDNYNSGAINVQLYFEELMKLARELTEEEQRTIALGLTEEELAIFDLLTRPGPNLAPKEEEQVKKVARDLLATLQRDKLVLDWRKKQQARAAVRLTIQRYLGRTLPDSYSKVDRQQKADVIYQHVYDAYAGAGLSIYHPAGRGAAAVAYQV